MVEQIFVSPQVQGSVSLVINSLIHELCNDFSNYVGTRMLGNYEISENVTNSIQFSPSAPSPSKIKIPPILAKIPRKTGT